MPLSLKLYIAGVAIAGAAALAVATLLCPPYGAIAMGGGPFGTFLGIAFWVAVTLVASALPIEMPAGMLVSVSIAPIVAAMVLGGPAVAGWVALIGATEVRELRGRIPWYGTVANHAAIVLPAILGGLAAAALGAQVLPLGEAFVATLAGSAVYLGLNAVLASTLVGLRTRRSPRAVIASDASSFYISLVALAPLAWLMAQIYHLAWWASLLFALPLYTTRLSNHRLVEMKEMFTQTVASLAGAVDKRDPFTANHSRNVQEISVDIGREMRLSDAELQALEWGGLLHDIGKIGVPDRVLLKTERLTREERQSMNRHPVLGAEIIAPVTKLAAELPIIRHHHEWYNGSGYPDRLMGDEIPKLARVLHVADAFEAMTAQRPYRMTPLTAEQAVAELRKFAGIQFDPQVVDAFVKTHWAEGVADPGRHVEPRPVPLLAQAAGRMAAQAAQNMPALGAPHTPTSSPTAVAPTGAPGLPTAQTAAYPAYTLQAPGLLPDGSVAPGRPN